MEMDISKSSGRLATTLMMTQPIQLTKERFNEENQRT